MIARISGRIDEIGNNYAVVDVAGVGYKLFLTADTLHGMKPGTAMKFWTYLAVRDDAMDLYGFASKKDRELFELLISVSGIGPKSALNILSLASADTLMSAIQTGSTAHLTKMSGIGKKTAEKIVLELRDKVDGISGEIESGAASAVISNDLDAIEALKSLGYDADEARDALKKVAKDVLDVGAKVKAALKHLA